MTEDAGVIELKVLVYPDGGTEVSVPPVDGERFAPVLESAAVALRRAADRARRDLEPVRCSECGEVPSGLTAAVAGVATLLPCGHSTS